jgi:hypothetical protein
MKKSITVTGLLLLHAIAHTAFAQHEKPRARKEVSQYGITWTFVNRPTTGQFITGDWW